MERATLRRPVLVRIQSPRILLALVGGLAAAILLGMVVHRAWETCGFGACPQVERLTAYQPGGASLVLDRHGEPFADLAPVEREVVPLAKLPRHVADAFLAVEDQRFRAHRGVDWTRVGGAVLANLRAGSFSQGFSTITMQLSRNLFPERIPGQERTVARKLLEVRVAREIEERFSKDEILELYLNHIYFGNGVRGIASASRHYFRRPASRLTLAQAALLAALPKAPTHYDPRQRPDAARERRDLVLARMAEQGRISPAQAAAARQQILGIEPPPRRSAEQPGTAAYFVEEVRRRLEERFGAKIYSDPVRIWTTLDLAAQRAAEEELARQLAAIEEGELGRFRGRRYSPVRVAAEEGTRYLQGAAVVLDAARGDVLAWVGGRNFDHSQFDRASRARRQPGSAFKPFVYAAALAEGWALSQPLVDRPLRMRLASGKVWQPRNFTPRYEGRVTVRDALIRSKNVATVRLAQQVGYGDIAELARQAGIEAPIPRSPSMPLGTVAVSPLEMATAYTAFAGLGIGVEPRFVLRVEAPDGRPLWQAEPVRREVLDPAVAYLVTDTLREALERGSGTAVREAGFRGPAAGKTGTSNGGVDAWFVGYTPQLVGAVWIGFDRPRPIADDAAGGRLAAPVWGRLMARLHRGRKPPRPWPQPEGLIRRAVDPGTGLILARGCGPAGGREYREIFIAGMEPASFCPGEEPVPRDGFYSHEMALAERQREEAEELGREREAREAEWLAEQREERQAQQAARQAEARRSAARKESEEAERRAREIEEREKALRAREERVAAAERRARKEEEEEEEERAVRREEERWREERRARLEEDEEEEAEERAAADLSGWWELTNRIESTDYDAYEGLRLGYRMLLRQEGNRLTGEGQKWSEDGRRIPSAQRTPITLTGTIEGRTVRLRFTERGARRASGGSFDWTLSGDRTMLRGSFASSAADTSGSSTARRIP